MTEHPRQAARVEVPQSEAHGGGHTGRNLIVCCDGTGNVWGNEHDTNVVKLVRMCVKSRQQLVYYDPGVGTKDSFPAVGFPDWVKFKLALLWGLAWGRGIYENIAQAYDFLVQNYREGDHIYLFGFSRGAFTARSVSGLVQLFGIVRPSATTLIPILIRNYFAKPSTQRDAFVKDVRANFTDPAQLETWIHFIGVWDTVDSVGGLSSQTISSPREIASKRFRHIRHAVSDGEYRAKYQPRLYEDDRDAARKTEDAQVGARSFSQLWFPGVHSDVGGSYPDGETGLSDGALQWIRDEAESCGLNLIAESERDRIQPNPLAMAHDQALQSPLWALTGLRRREPPALEVQHPSLQIRIASSQVEEPPNASLFRDRWFWISFVVALAFSPLDGVWLSAIERAAVWLSRIASVISNYAFVLAFTCFACTLSVHAIRALRTFKPAVSTLHASLDWTLRIGLRTILFGGLLSVTWVWAAQGAVRIWDADLSVPWFASLTLAVLFAARPLLGLLARSSHATRPRERPSTSHLAT